MSRGVIDLRTEAMRALLQSPLEYPFWSPAASAWDAENLARITSLRIPKTSEQGGRTGDPDLILYRLGHLGELDPAFDDRIREFTAGGHHTLLVNASGSGKTRLTLETLYRHWGFYLGCDIDYTVNPYGSEDFPNAVSDLDARMVNVPLAPRKERLSSLEQNQQLVALHVRQVMLARLLVLDHYLGLVEQYHVDDADARVKWLWLQLRPTELVGRDIFSSVQTKLHAWSEEKLATRMHELVEKHQHLVEFVVVDEAQIPAAQSPESFLDSKHRLHYSLLYGLITYLSTTFKSSRCIVSGTRVPFSLIEDAIGVSGHAVKVVKAFTNLGCFGDLARTSQYLRHFLGSELSDDDCAIAHRWLYGRHRMMSVLVNRTLRSGPTRFRRLVDSIVFTTADFDPHCRGGGPMIDVNLSPIVREETLEGSHLAPALRSAAYIYITHGLPASFAPNSEELVGLGLARFGTSMGLAIIDEPVMLLNIARWLQNSRKFSAGAIIQRRLRDPSMHIRGLALAEGIALSLWNSFAAAGFRLDQIAAFPGTAPSWASRRATFCLTSMRSGARSFRKCSTTMAPLVRVARDVEDVLDWFSGSTTPFLLPDASFGAQLIFVLSVPPSHRLVFVHVDPFDCDRPHRYNQVVARDPTKLYYRDRAANAKFAVVLASFAPEVPRQSTRSGPAQKSPARNTLQLYCFAGLSKPDRPYDPPVATLRLRALVSSGQVTEITPAFLGDFIT